MLKCRVFDRTSRCENRQSKQFTVRVIEFRVAVPFPPSGLAKIHRLHAERNLKPIETRAMHKESFADDFTF